MPNPDLRPAEFGAAVEAGIISASQAQALETWRPVRNALPRLAPFAFLLPPAGM
jgi:hypothetical protein